MKRFGLILAALMGLAASAVPASAGLQYTLNEGGTIGPTPGNFGTVTLTGYGTGTNPNTFAYVKVDVELAAGENFVGTGAGYAITWNITGNPNLEVAGDNSPSTSFNPALPLPTGFALQNSGDKGKTYKASPFGSSQEYAIRRSEDGNSGTKYSSLIFDVTEAGGITLADFVAVNGIYFTADIYYKGNTGDVAVPEPRTWLMFLAGLTLLPLLQRRRKRVRAS